MKVSACQDGMVLLHAELGVSTHTNKLPQHAELALRTRRICVHMRKLNWHRAVAKLHFSASISLYFQWITSLKLPTWPQCILVLPLLNNSNSSTINTYFVMHFGIPKYGEVNLVAFVLFNVMSASTVLSFFCTFLANSISRKAV